MPTSSVGAPRQLLRRLREVMAQRESAQARLDKVVVLIASNMVAEVCSLYLRRRDGSLELFATEGLNPEAVHNTHLKPGEGLLSATGGEAQVSLSWNANTEPDLAGYDLYRDGVKVNTTPLTSTTYTDTGRTPGTTYTYTVKALDTNTNASPANQRQ